MEQANHKYFSQILLSCVFIILLILPAWLGRNQSHLEESVNFDTTNALTHSGFYLEAVSEKAGVRFIHKPPRLDPKIDPILPQVASMGASVSVCDFNNDGWNDFYVTTSRFGEKNELYMNNMDGTFTGVADNMGLSDLNKSDIGVCMGSVWADFDNDGFEDIFIYRWGRPSLFKNMDGKSFKEVTDSSGIPHWINANNAIWLDYDNDGNVDLFIGGYFPESINLWNLTRTDILTESFEYAQNGGRNYLLKNNGTGHFKDVTIECGLTSTRWTLASGAMDLNSDGFPELVIANDFGIDEFYVNEAGKGFKEFNKEVMVGFAPKSGMNVSFGDVFNNGNPGIYISNITEEGILMQGNNFWYPDLKDNKIVYRNEATRLGIESGGWSYSAQFGDLNNDGFLDIYLANGYISGEKGTNYWYDYAKVTGGNKAIISDIKNWPPMAGRSHSGFQQNRIWMNEKGAYFTEVSSKVASTESNDSRGVAMVDLWNRGVVDLIVANQNGPVVILKNHAQKDQNWVEFTLTGTKSNRSAIGAIVLVYWDQLVQKQVVTGGIGFNSQNQRRLHFGLGHAPKIDKVEIIWPGGKTETIINPQLNHHHRITEK